ncbi:MAG: DUF4249 family protein [Deltaproteobacteria bacterium]
MSFLFALAFVGSCKLGEIAVGKTAPVIVVHSVLNPSFGSQVVLVERTLSGAVTIPDTSFDPNNPIVTGGGVPVSGALVELIDSTGKSAQGVEDVSARTDGRGAGVYRISLGFNGTQTLRLGMRYQLHIHTLEGDDVTAFTRVPAPDFTSSGGFTRTFNRDRDTLNVQWSPTPKTRSYAVRVESPFGPFFLFTDSTRFRMTGDLRNLFAGDLQRVFIPGFRQDMLVAAVDSNFYDYYRTNNDPFTGTGIISRVNGGLGLFGALVSLNSGTLTVVANQTEPIEARFRLISAGGTAATVASQFTLYVESKATRSDLPTALSGRYVAPAPTPHGDGILGQQLGSSITLALLANQLSGDTVDVFTGELRGDTLSGSYRKNGGTSVFLRNP